MNGGNLSNQMDAAPPASPAWLPLWVLHSITDVSNTCSKANTLPCHVCKVYPRARLSTSFTINDDGRWAFKVGFLQPVYNMLDLHTKTWKH